VKYSVADFPVFALHSELSEQAGKHMPRESLSFLSQHHEHTMESRSSSNLLTILQDPRQHSKLCYIAQ